MRTDFVLDALEQLCTPGNRSATGAWSVTPIGDLSTSAFSTQSGWPKPASSHLWAARATDSYDNDLPETVDGLYKAELIQRRAPWRTKEAVKLAQARALAAMTSEQEAAWLRSDINDVAVALDKENPFGDGPSIMF